MLEYIQSKYLSNNVFFGLAADLYVLGRNAQNLLVIALEIS